MARTARDQYFKPAGNALFEHSLHGCSLVSKDGYFIAANNRFCQITEYSELELIKRNISDITDPDDITDDLENMERIADGKIASYEMLKGYLSKSKRLVRVRLRVDAIRGADGSFICFLAQVTLTHGGTMSNVTLTKGDLSAVKVLKKLRENASIVLWVLSIIGGIAAWFINHSPRH